MVAVIKRKIPKVLLNCRGYNFIVRWLSSKIVG